MSRQRKYHIPGFEQTLKKYADSRVLDLAKLSPWHLRLTDGGYTTVDAWTTGKYYIQATDYVGLDLKTPERTYEKGNLPMGELTEFLDKIFYGPKAITK